MYAFKNYSTVIGLIIFMWSLGSCKSKPEQNGQEPVSAQEPVSDTITFTPAQISLAKIETGTFEMHQLSKDINTNGIVDLPPNNIADISSITGGMVKSIGDISIGKYVRKGEVLANIENPEFITFQKDYMESRGQYEYLSAEYNRQLELSKESAVSQKTLQQVKSDYESVKARLLATSAQLDMLGIDKENIDKNGIRSAIPIKAPISGYITEININLGKYVQAGETMFEMADKSEMRLLLNLYEKDLSAVSVNDEVTFTTVADPRGENTARVKHIGEIIDNDKRSVRLTAQITSDVSKFHPGMYVTAYIRTDTKNVCTLPQTAVIQNDNIHYIFIGQDNLFVKKEVKVGMVQDNFMEIINRNDFPAGEKIVTKGAYYIEAELLKRLE